MSAILKGADSKEVSHTLCHLKMEHGECRDHSRCHPEGSLMFPYIRFLNYVFAVMTYNDYISSTRITFDRCKLSMPAILLNPDISENKTGEHLRNTCTCIHSTLYPYGTIARQVFIATRTFTMKPANKEPLSKDPGQRRTSRQRLLPKITSLPDLPYSVE